MFPFQFVQTEVPVIDLYFPTVHPVHVPPLGPENPVLHKQAIAFALFIRELEFAGHFVQTAVPKETEL